MPTPFLHLRLAYELMRDPSTASVIDAQAPDAASAFLLGNIAPDVAQSLGRPRSATHFWTTENDVSGVLKLLAAQPHLTSRELSGVDRVFVAGYLCHLVADEQWTFTIWRPYFGRYTRYAGGPEGAARQAAFRDAIDARDLDAPPGAGAAARDLARAARIHLSDGLLPFVAVDSLHWLRDAVASHLRACASPDRRSSAADSNASAGDDRSLGSPAQSAALSYVRPESLMAFHRRAIAASIDVLGDYLAGRAVRPPPGTTGANDVDNASART